MKALLALCLATVSPLALAAGGDVQGLMNLLIYIVIIGLVFWCIWWFLGYVGVPEPFNKVIRVIIGLVALIIVVNLLLGMTGSGPIFKFR